MLSQQQAERYISGSTTEVDEADDKVEPNRDVKVGLALRQKLVAETGKVIRASTKWFL